MRCPSLAHNACHLMSPSSHRETKWTGKLAQDRCFPSKLAPTERRTPLHFQPGIPASPLLSWRWPGRAAVPDTVASTCAAGGGTGPPCCLVVWHSRPGGTPAPGDSALAQAQGSAPFAAGITALPLAQTDGEQARLHLLWLFGHYRDLFRPTQIWLAGVRIPNANTLAGAAVS